MLKPAIAAALMLAVGGAATAQNGDASAARAEAKLEKALAGLTPGEPRKCLDKVRVNYTRSFPDTILFVEGRKRIYRNDMRGNGCLGLKHDDIIVSRTFNGQYCAGDIIETHSRIGGMITGSCSLGEFVPYTAAKSR